VRLRSPADVRRFLAGAGADGRAGAGRGRPAPLASLRAARTALASVRAARRPMRRVVVIGNSGSGKTTLARALAGRLGVPHVELDGIFYQANWRRLPREEFRARVAAATAGDGWVVDGNHRNIRDLVWVRADTLVWNDLGRPVVTWRVLSRTVRRWVLREEVWNGNREPLRWMLTLNRRKSVILWSITSHSRRRHEFAALPADPRWAHLTWVRLRSRRAVRAFLAGAAADR
jgi:adenylate kinase family enzyme